MLQVRSEKQVSDANQEAGQAELVEAKEAMAAGRSAMEAASHTATQELDKRRELEQQLADVQQKLHEVLLVLSSCVTLCSAAL